MGKEEEQTLEKWRKRVNVATLGVVAIGYIFGLPGLVFGGALHIATSETFGKGFTEWLKRRKKKQNR